MSLKNEIVAIPTVPVPAAVITSNQQSPLTRAEYAAQIGGEWRRGVLSIIEVGRLLNKAQQTLDEDDFHAMVADDLPFPRSTTSMLRKVATRFGGVLYTEKLPPSWMTLYLLTRLPPVEFDRRLADGSINSAVAQRQVRGWIQDAAGSRKQPAPPDESGSEESPVREQCPQREDAIETPKEDPPGAHLETRSTETEDEVDSSSIAPDGPQELDPGVSAADAADEEALSAVKLVWCHASTRARKRIGAFVIKATVEQRGEAGEIGRPIV
jgi:hypothetical protein